MALPGELDFKESEDFDKARLDRAMEYIVARFRALEANAPALALAIDDLRALGLQRLNEVLLPVFNDVIEISEALTALREEWIDNDIIGQMVATVTGTITDEFADYRMRYLGAKASAPTVDDEGNSVTIGAMYFNTALEQMQVLGIGGWKDAGSVVSGLMNRQSFTATGGETSVTVPGGYDPGNIVVYVNGLALSPDDVTVTSGTTIGLPGALTTGDEVFWVKFTALTLANVYTKADSDGLFLPKAGGTVTGPLNYKTLTGALNASSTLALDLANAGYFKRTLTGNSSITFTNVPATGVFCGVLIELVNGGLSVTDPFPTTVRWRGGVRPVRTTSGKDVFAIWTTDGGASWDAVQVSRDSKIPS